MTDQKLIPVRQFGLSGEIKDVQPFDLPLNAVRSARNCRIEDNAVRTYSNSIEFMSDVASETPVYAKAFWRQSGNEGQIVVYEVDPGPTIEIRFVDRAGTETDITPLSAPSTSDCWYGVQLGDWFILTNGVDDPLQTDTALTRMVTLPGWDTDYKANVIEAYKNHLVAVDITKLGTAKPRMVKWCHPFADGDVTTDWDHTSSTNRAGETTLSEPGRNLVGAQQVRDSLMLYFDRKTWRADFVGGQFVFDFQQVFTDDGIVGCNGHVTVPEGAIVFGYRDIYLHDGFTKRSLTDGKNTKYLYDVLDLSFEVSGAYYPKRNEAIFLCRTNPSGDGNLLLTYDMLHDAWFEGLAEVNGDGILTQVFVGMRPASSVTGYDDWTTETIDSFDDTTYADLMVGDETVTLFGLSSTQGVIYDMDYQGTDPSAVSIFRDEFLIEKTAIDLDELQNGVGKNVIMIGRIYPQISGSGKVNVTVGSHMRANASVDWGSPVEFDMDSEFAVDCRVSGRYLAIKFEPVPGEDVPLMSLSGFDIEWEHVGER